MPCLSSLFATLLALVIGVMALAGQFLGGSKSWGVWPVVYLIAAAVSGWVYTSCRVKTVGWIHVLFMFGIAGVCGAYGMSVLGDGSITGGRGPDANPVAGIIYGFGLLGMVIAIATLICGVGVTYNVLRGQKVESTVP